jgi:hypothetical protein
MGRAYSGSDPSLPELGSNISCFYLVKQCE